MGLDDREKDEQERYGVGHAISLLDPPEAACKNIISRARRIESQRGFEKWAAGVRNLLTIFQASRSRQHAEDARHSEGALVVI